jgi:hypothetical protein
MRLTLASPAAVNISHLHPPVSEAARTPFWQDAAVILRRPEL